MGPHQVNVGLGDGSHTDLVIGSGQERGKGAGECDCAIARGTANGNADLQRTENGVSQSSFTDGEIHEVDEWTDIRLCSHCTAFRSLVLFHSEK